LKRKLYTQTRPKKMGVCADTVLEIKLQKQQSDQKDGEHQQKMGEKVE